VRTRPLRGPKSARKRGRHGLQRAAVALLDALRALTAFDPPDVLPPCDLPELADVLDAHGLAPIASYHLENRRIGAGIPDWFRERLLPIYQGVVNDNVFKLVTLKGALKEVDVPVVLLEGAAYVDWLYPHLAFRPVGELRLAVRGADGARFASAIAAAGFGRGETGSGGHTATFDDGRITVRFAVGLGAGAGDDRGLFERAERFRAMGPTAARPSAEDALLGTVGEMAALGLHAPLLLCLDLRELLAQPALASPERQREVQTRAEELGLSRALHGSCALAAHFFPEVEAPARALSPHLGHAERLAVERIVESAKDPTRTRLPRGAAAAARGIVAP
jgi:hypothetical protein